MSFISIAKPLAFAVFTDSGSRFDRRVAFGSAREAAFGPSGRPPAGFRRASPACPIPPKATKLPGGPVWA